MSSPVRRVDDRSTSITVYTNVLFTFSSTVAGTAPFSYQWNTNGVNILNATNPTFSVRPPLGTITVGLRVTNSLGSDSNFVFMTGIVGPTGAYRGPSSAMLR